MTADSGTHTRLGTTLRDFRSSWKPLALTDLAFKVMAFIILTPLAGIAFRFMIALSGRASLSDVDILMFFLGPVGWICGVMLGAIWLAIVALEQAALMGVVYARAINRRVGVVGALRIAAANAWPILQVTGRIAALVLLAVAPFLVLAAVVYFSLLTEYDINFYLKERPPVFQVALGIGGVLLALLTFVLLRLVTVWFFALPLVLFENVSPGSALRLSGERTRGSRRTILWWVIGWALVMLVISTLTTALVGIVGHLLAPESTASLHRLVFAIGTTLLLWTVVNLIVNLFSTTTFATILFNLYRHLGGGQLADVRFETSEQRDETSGPWMTRRRLVAVGIFGVVVAVTIGIVAARTVRLKDDVLVMAHRGASKAAPENTMAAIHQAIEDGADWVEIDVQETADGQVVVLHDSDFMKIAGSDLKIWDATLQDLEDIDIGSWFAPEFKDQRVPTLGDVLDECKGKVGVNIELKYYGHDQQLEQRVAEIVESHDMASDIKLMSLKMDGVVKMKSVRPDWKVGLLMSVAAGDIKDLEVDFLAVNAQFASRRLIRTAHASGKQVYVWTVNDAPTMSSMISRGVDGLLTDKPALAQSVLEQRAEMSVPERLLLELSGLLGTVPEFGEQ
jgi:glycerophosphoryl diester phosphodiesterase